MTRTGNRGFALDTNIVIDLFKGQKSIGEEIKNAESVYLPITTLGELYYGAFNSLKKDAHLKQIEGLLKFIDVLNTSSTTASVYGEIKNDLRKVGRPIPENDIWIAALTLEHDLTLVTGDRHFDNISNLSLVQW